MCCMSTVIYWIYKTFVFDELLKSILFLLDGRPHRRRQ